MPEIRFPPYAEPFFQPKRYKGLYGGRGSGKSHTFAGLAILKAAETPGLRIVCVREVQRSIADSVKQLLEDKIALYGFEGLFESVEAEIRGSNGSRIIFRGMQNHTAASIKSLEGFDIAWVEEAQTISQRSLELLTPTIRKEGSEIWFSWNPENEDDPVDTFLRKATPENAMVEKVNWDNNPWFPEELKNDLERDRRRDPDKFAHVWGGEYRSMSEARVFRNWREGEIDVPSGAVWYYGADWGFSNDPTAAIRCCFPDDETLYIDHEAYEVGVAMEALPPLISQIPQANKWPMRADSARPETIDYVKRHGFPRMRGAKKGKGSVEDGVTFIQSYDVVIHPRCVNTLREFKSYAYKTDKQTGEILPVIEDKNNHAIDALRYAVEGLHSRGQRIKSYDEKPQSTRRSYFNRNEGDVNWKTQ